MRLPDFVIIGAAKAGTTTLYDYLDRHPHILMSDPKEPEFFARNDRYSLGIQWYSQLFNAASSTEICGEASTIYSLYPHFPYTATRMSKYIPNAKLVYMMREPVSRAYSNYVQLVKNRQNYSSDYSAPRSFEDYVYRSDSFDRYELFSPFDDHLPSNAGFIIDASDYLVQIRHYLEKFPKDNIMFIIFEEFISSTEEVLRRIYNFLGVPLPKEDVVLVARNVASDHFTEVRRSLFGANLMRRNPALARVARHFPQSSRLALRNALFQMNRQFGRNKEEGAIAAPPPMEAATRRLLEVRFERQRSELAQITGLDLDTWWPSPARS